MDTILYFYKKKEIEYPFIEAIRQSTYMLIRVGMDVEPYRWFMQSLPRRRPMPEILAEDSRKPEVREWFSVRGFQARWELRAHRKEWKRYQSQIDTLAARCRENVEALISEMMQELLRYASGLSDCRCVYDKTVRDVLYGDNPVSAIWQSLWRAEEFTGYMELSWVRQLMASAHHPHFVVLGEAPCIPELLQQSAERMKSLRWIVEDTWAEAHDEELEDFAESFYQEQGLAVTIERVWGKQGFRKLRLVCREPSNILDFTGEDRISPGETAKGSVWLDMCSSAEKCRWITRRSTGIQYYSLREKWRQTQKKSYCLDTVDKNEYNT